MKRLLVLGFMSVCAAPLWGQSPVTMLPTATPTVAKRTTAPLRENLEKFDSLRLQVGWSRAGWQLMDGKEVLKDFGKNQREAREARRIIRDLRLTHRGTVGKPQTVMEYWLSDRRAPSGRVRGMRVFLMDRQSLRVEQVSKQWCLRDNARIYFNFGLREEEARQALAIIERYRFNRLAVLGQAIPSMMVFLSSQHEWRGIPAQPTLAHRLEQRPSLQDRVNQLRKSEDKAKKPNTQLTTASQYATPALPPLRAESGPKIDTGLRRVSHRVEPTRSVPGLSDLTTRIPFDWRQVQLHSKNGEYWLQVGAHTVCRFGKNEKLARQAVGLIHYYRFNVQCLVGYPKPLYSYFLVNGNAPRGVPFGTRYVAFEPKRLKIANVSGTWSLCEGDKPLLGLGPRRDEAYQLLQSIQFLRADRLCWLGDDTTRVFTFFAKAK